MLQVPLPELIVGAPPPEVQERIARAKKALGSRLVVLGHHYQRDEVIVHADFTGDSFKLAQLAASRPDAELIVFCGVHFMAESADILSGPNQKVILPDMNAGCTMADMAETGQVEECWADVTEVLGDDILPVTYMNSTAALKALVGRNGGAVCTSSNARAVLDWAFRQKPRVLFFPDQHLGRNTGYRMGVPLEGTGGGEGELEPVPLRKLGAPPCECKNPLGISARHHPGGQLDIEDCRGGERADA